MGAELNALDWLFAAGQGLFAASFFYFLYLVIRFSQIATIIRHGLARGPGAASEPECGTEIYSFSGE